MKSWLNALARTRDKIVGGLAHLIPGLSKADPAALEEWERSLIQSDIAPRLVGEWIQKLSRKGGSADMVGEIRTLLEGTFPSQPPFGWKAHPGPKVILIVGVNGSGKTTTTAKLGYLVKRQGLSPLLAAADTFRAAGAHQLKLWAERLKLDAVVGAHGADSAAVAYDAVRAAIARKADVVLIDTAGRMHTKQPLMEELQKVRRSIDKALPGAPHETWIVLDATLGNNAVIQARMFKECVALTGVVVAKLDGSSKGGFLFTIRRELELPVYFVGLGEGEDDLAEFNSREFVKGFLGLQNEDGG
ncbi:MAG: signal recognition particle-docking protein FtsY [bacterium]